MTTPTNTYAVWATPVKDPILAIGRTARGEPLAFWVTRPTNYTKAMLDLGLQRTNPYWTYDVHEYPTQVHRPTAWERLSKDDIYEEDA